MIISETMDFNPYLLESSFADGEEKEECPNFLQVLSCNGQGTQNSFFRDLELSIAKELTDSWFVAVDDRKEKNDFNPNLLESSFADGEEKESPDFLQVLSCNDQGMQNSHFRGLELSIAKELTDSWFVPVHEIKRSRSDREAATMWDVDDSSVDKELLKKYLKRLSAEDAKRKKEEVKLDPKLFQVKDGAGYHSLTPIEKRHWITLQFIMECYEPPYRSLKPEPPAVFEEPGQEDSDQEDSGQEDYISDLSSMFLEDSGNMM